MKTFQHFIYFLFLCIWILWGGNKGQAQSIQFKESEEQIEIENGKITVSFQKKNADLLALKNAAGLSLLGKNGRGYLLGPGFSMYPSNFKIVRQNKELIELSFYHEASNHFQYDLHYVIKKNDPGLYCFLVQSHKATDSAGYFGQTRWGIRADESIFNYHLVRDSIQGIMPAMRDLKKDIQDWTFELGPDSFYTKYDYADYIEDRHVHGMAGTESHQGLFVMQASHEYLNGGPTKQYQNVHSTPFLINMFNCGHFLSDIRKGDDKIEGDWTKLNGPFYLYTNTGSSIQSMWKDAKERALQEQKSWPYHWMEHENYPLSRGTLIGQLFNGKNPATEGTQVILAGPDYDWQAQSQGYIFNTKTGPAGKFKLDHVRAGTYTLYAFGSNQTVEFQKKDIQIYAAKTKDLGKFGWPVSTAKTLWQLGIADRSTKGFKMSNWKRNYANFKKPPAHIRFTIGKDDPAESWYYAQTKAGAWEILFPLENNISDTVLLEIAFAGVARNPLLEIECNGESIEKFTHLGNDASVYRSAMSGGYYQLKQVYIDGKKLRVGENILSFKLPNPKPGAGIMYDAIKLSIPK